MELEHVKFLQNCSFFRLPVGGLSIDCNTLRMLVPAGLFKLDRFRPFPSVTEFKQTKKTLNNQQVNKKNNSETQDSLRWDQPNAPSATWDTISSAWLTLSQTTNFRLFQAERLCRRQFQI